MTVVQTKFKTMYLVSRKPDVDAHSNNPSIPPADIPSDIQPGPSSHKCPHCSISFLNDEALQEHIRTNHANSMLHECTKCNYKTPNLLEYKEHFDTQHRAKKRALSEEKDESSAKRVADEDKCDTCGNDGHESATQQNNPIPLAPGQRRE